MSHYYSNRREANKNIKILLRKVFKTSTELKEKYLIAKFIRYNFTRKEQKREFGCTDVETEILTEAAKEFIALPNNRTFWHELFVQQYNKLPIHDQEWIDIFDGISEEKITEIITCSLTNKMLYSSRIQLL